MFSYLSSFIWNESPSPSAEAEVVAVMEDPEEIKEARAQLQAHKASPDAYTTQGCEVMLQRYLKLSQALRIHKRVNDQQQIIIEMLHFMEQHALKRISTVKFHKAIEAKMIDLYWQNASVMKFIPDMHGRCFPQSKSIAEQCAGQIRIASLAGVKLEAAPSKQCHAGVLFGSVTLQFSPSMKLHYGSGIKTVADVIQDVRTYAPVLHDDGQKRPETDRFQFKEIAPGTYSVTHINPITTSAQAMFVL